MFGPEGNFATDPEVAEPEVVESPEEEVAGGVKDDARDVENSEFYERQLLDRVKILERKQKQLRTLVDFVAIRLFPEDADHLMRNWGKIPISLLVKNIDKEVKEKLIPRLAFNITEAPPLNEIARLDTKAREEFIQDISDARYRINEIAMEHDGESLTVGQLERRLSDALENASLKYEEYRNKRKATQSSIK